MGASHQRELQFKHLYETIVSKAGNVNAPFEHDPEKWVPVFRLDHAQTKSSTIAHPVCHTSVIARLRAQHASCGEPMTGRQCAANELEAEGRASHGFHDVRPAEGMADPGAVLHDQACAARGAGLQA